MSTSYSVFVKKNAPLLEIKSALEEILNCALEKDISSDFGAYDAYLLGLEIRVLPAADYEDVDDLELSRYDYQIFVDYLPHAFDEIYADGWRIMASLIIGSMLSKKLKCECIVVKDVEVLIQKFLSGEGEIG